MGSINRYQLVAALAAVVFALGTIRAARILLGSSVSETEAVFAGSPTGPAPLTLSTESRIETIPSVVRRSPFEEPSPWQAPRPEDLPPPPPGDLLRLSPAPLLLRPDGVPRLGSIPRAEEPRADSKLLAKLRQLFRSSGKEAAE